MNKNLTNNVHCGDDIRATLDCNGRCLAKVSGMAFTSLDEVKRTLLDLAGRYTGMALLTVRNCTQGWRDVSAVATLRRPTLPQHPVDSAPQIGGQYLIPWAS
ncbi:MAG: hypothetical protein IKZ92_08000 [Muribaculaceae bacterium]|nr:hypothetical protein [Muribaculaceae bacterium]